MTARFLVAFLLALFFNSAYATLEECYHKGLDKDYEKVLELCKPYLKTDARATGLLAEAHIQLDQGDKVALEDAQWAVDFYEKNGAPTDPEGLKAYSYLVYLIGELYFFGSDDVKVDQQKGLDYIIKSANLGYSVAQNQLGNFYVRSGKVPGANFAKAFKWYKLAIANGSLDARNAFLVRNEQSFIAKYPYCISQGKTLIGDAYFNGQAGLPKDIDMAIEWYNKAYSIDDHIAPVEVSLARAYIAKGDKKTAYKYTREAITQPYAPAFVVMSELTDNDVAKYAYLSEAIALFKNPELSYWSQFNEYCQLDISDKGLKDAQEKLSKIKLTKEEVEIANSEEDSLRSHWQSIQAAQDMA
ncbi:hypothetical protein LO80_07625 [Candidatus Francisella endociliophora]|uniref:Sel1 repeat family protein n=1 Tax=Candidatus Francisella endociliophora TaxID=653937 RepID=A0A097EQK9_9GAMM|nr:SEL1-like repeat protein [Francisella sp. FSC1006]AIT09853.1 hypothetical protein LO80_07625 [Francisella sp. FSC1006]